MRFSHTQVSTYQECQRKFKNWYLLKQRPIKRANYFVLGNAVHSFIDIFYGTKDINLAAKQVESVYAEVDRSLLSPEEIHDLECDKNIALGISKAYPKFYSQDFDEFKTFLTEKEATIKLNGHNTYYMKLDVLIQDHSGAWWILETKTASPHVLTAGYFDRVRIDGQISGYMWGAKQILGEFPTGVIYNVIKKPAIRLKKGESYAAFQNRIFLEYTKFAEEKHYFSREQIILGTDQLESWYENMCYITDDISSRVERKEKLWPMTTGACVGKYGNCAYLQSCSNGGKFNSLLYRKEQ